MSAAVKEVEVKERPIIFSGPMVKAILEGRKTQTRRAVAQPNRVSDEWKRADTVSIRSMGKPWEEERYLYAEFFKFNGDGSSFGNVVGTVACPYGQPGDRLWVREVFAHLADLKTKDPGIAALMSRAFYRADHPTGLSHDDASDLKWRSPLFLPRELSRITLEITKVSVGRIREISEADAIAEGVRQLRDGSGTYAGREGPGNLVTPWLTAKEAFADAWDSINAKRGFSFDSNCWVWVIEFRKL